MDEALLSYYNRELSYIRNLGAEFAKKHPKIAGRLRLDRDTVEDPHVSRLIESFAFLTARIRHKLDDSFPELTEALMGLLYPDFHAPIPSLSVVQFYLIPGQPESVRRLPAGTELYTDSNPHGRVHYRTCYDTLIYPFKVNKAQFVAQPFRAPTMPDEYSGSATQAILRLTLKTGQNAPFNKIRPKRLRFYLNGQPQLTFRLYEFLLNHAATIAIGEHPRDPKAVFFPGTCLTPVGFGDTEAALPADGRSTSAHRLLSEYFAFPEKFLFVDLNLPPEAWDNFSEAVNIYIYFDQTHLELMQGVSAETLVLGCSPMINLYSPRLKSIATENLGYEAKLQIDTASSHCADIHTVLQVTANNQLNKTIDIQPFYGSHRSKAAEIKQPLYWHIRREASQWMDGRVSYGTDTYISLVDTNFQISEPEERWHISVEALCTNRDLPDKLPFGPDEPKMEFMQSGGAGLRIKCVSAPTATIQPRLHEATRWQLVTQLSLQHFMGDEGLLTLKEMLRLYDAKQNADTRSIIDGLVGMKTSLTTAHIRRGGRKALCQGTHIELELDERFYSGSGIYLFSAVLNEFFAQYCSINSFTQLTICVHQSPDRKIEWPPRSGKQNLL